MARAFIDRARDFLSNDYLRKIECCLDRLKDEQIWWRPNSASNSIGNLVVHLCGNARQWILSGLGGTTDDRQRDSEFSQREIVIGSVLQEHLRSTIAAVDRVLDGLDPKTLLERRTIQGKDVDVLEAVFHVTEHFSMHTGQIILLTKVLTESDLGFYEFPGGLPVNRWNKE